MILINTINKYKFVTNKYFGICNDTILSYSCIKWQVIFEGRSVPGLRMLRYLQRRRFSITINVSRDSKTHTGAIAYENCRTKSKIGRGME